MLWQDGRIPLAERFKYFKASILAFELQRSRIKRRFVVRLTETAMKRGYAKPDCPSDRLLRPDRGKQRLTSYSLFERHADAPCVSPSHFAVAHCAVSAKHQIESFRHAQE
jgi:hypothetical protein